MHVERVWQINKVIPVKQSKNTGQLYIYWMTLLLEEQTCLLAIYTDLCIGRIPALQSG